MIESLNRSGPIQLLLIEDDPGDAMLVRLQLQEDLPENFHIETASSLRSARQLLETSDFEPDLVLLDLNLPDSSGPASVENCRALTSAPIVVLTGLDDLAVTQLAIETGAEDYLSKGSKSSDLQRAIFYAILRHRREGDVRLAASVFTHAREGITVTDLQARILEVNDAFTRITGYSREEAIGKNPSILKSDRHGPEFYADMWRALTHKGYWEGEIWNRRKDGAIYAELLTISAVSDHHNRPQHYVALFSDITAQKVHKEHLQRLAHYDALTELPNRVLLGDRLHQAMVRAKRLGSHLALAYIDLDGFKAVNDIHGHATGDQLLIAIAKRMCQSVREGDTIARLGGDEFIALLSDLENRNDCLSLIHRLLAASSQPILLDGLDLHISASIGLSFYPQNEEIDADQLVRQADQAMYQAKLSGKNRFHLFDTQQEQQLRIRHEAIDELRHGLGREELLLYYQPKVKMRPGEVIGVEALVRWQHPVRGFLLPGAFLPLVQHDSIAIDLDRWVLKTALQQLQTWQAQGLALSVSVNLSAQTLRMENFTEQLQELLASYPGVSPSSLELEVLETSALDDMAHVSKLIQQCAELGVLFALDDFGTGYSSLTYLKQLPAKHLKIDQSFVRDMLFDSEDLAILEAVIGLASAFRRQVIAEGVETCVHGEILLQLGCEVAQGYGIARPMPAAELPDWIRHWRPPPSWAESPKLHPNDLPLLYAEVEHRAWVSALKTHLHNPEIPCPTIEVGQCRFGQWLDKQDPHNGPDLGNLRSYHERIHTLAKALLQQTEPENATAVLSRLSELEACSEKLLQELSRLNRSAV